MVKTIIKELIITVLLCIAIILILGVVFYSYNPVNKIVPSKVEQYSTSDTIKEKINVNVLTIESMNVIYKVEDTDLNMYIKNKSYVQGKANPFEVTSSSTGSANGNTNSTGNTGTSSGQTANGNEQTTNNSTSSDGTFWNSTKTK